MRIRDAALPLGLAAVVAAVAVTGADPDDRALWPWGGALILVSAAALLWRQRHPIPVLAVAGATCLAYYPLGFPDSPIALSLVVALYTVARRHGPLPSGAVAAALLVLVTVTAADPLPTAAAVGPLLTLPVVLGEVIRGRARQIEEAEERRVLAERQTVLAEQSRESEALRRATEERLRISRELHDTLGHQLSLISVQAGAALHTRAPDTAFAALQAIRAASGDALRDLREVLGVLREPIRPGLAALPDLADRTAATGLTVHTAIDVPEPTPPAAVQQAAYRIVQEALTNTIRHATAVTTVQVTVRAGTASTPSDHHGPMLAVLVENDGDEVGDIVEGNGVRGMTERAGTLGGTLAAGPRPGGGFRVQAHLPLGPPRGVTADPSGPAGLSAPAADDENGVR